MVYYLLGVCTMKYKLIAIDMDGTLLNSKNNVSNRTKKAIIKAKEKGVHVVLSTGRILKSAIYYSQKLGLKNPIVASNGGIIVDENSNLIYKKPLDKQSIKKIADMADEDDVYFHLYDETKFYSSRKVQEFLDFYRQDDEKTSIDFQLFKHIDEIINTENLNIYKFLFIDENKRKLQNFREKISTISDISISSSWSNNVEAMALNVSKGEALSKLSEILNIKLKDIITIGDSENDLSMLNISGLSVAMGNASHKIKEKADYITDTNDNDGVAKAIEKFILESDKDKYES